MHNNTYHNSNHCFPQMAQRSLPAVLLLLLGFVEAVDIKGNKIVIVIINKVVIIIIIHIGFAGGSESPFSLNLDFVSPAPQDFFFKVQ